MIVVNLPVADLARAIAFYEALGATRNPQFSNDQAACMVLSDTIHVMLLVKAMFQTFTPKPIADAHATTEVLICICMDGRAEVDGFIRAGSGAGGTGDPVPPQDHGFMYGRSLEDPDGHIWEAMWMDPAGMTGACAPAA